MEELQKFQSSTFDTIARRRLVEDQDTILELTGKIQELQQILADCQAEIQKHEFQADCDRRSIQKLKEVIESQKEENFAVLIKETNDFDKIINFFMKQNWDLREAHEKSSVKWKNWSDFKAQHSTQLRGENWSKIEIPSLNSLARYRNHKMKSIAWTVREIFKMLNQYAVDTPTLPVNLRLSHLIQFLVEC